ncbi:hypothetical protein [Thomasclavelia spiroformis]|nr:hypothetical protein [Thomasclavelia spiroformis]
MFEFECLTKNDDVTMSSEECLPFLGECYPIAEDCCGPDCSPN